MSRRRVVVTGLGGWTAHGESVNEIFNNVVHGVSAISNIENFAVKDFIKPRIGGEIKLSQSALFEKYKTELRRNDMFIVYGLYATQCAIEDAKLENISEEIKDRTGIIMGSGIGGLQNTQKASEMIFQDQRLTPFFIPSVLVNLLPGQVGIQYGFRGPINAISTACATGTNAVGEAMRLIKDDMCDIVIAGGSEAAVCNLGMAGFAAMKALSSSFNDTPEKASRPWDVARDGFVMSDGAVTLILEEYEHAKKRGAKIYAEVAGYGMSSDGHHITAPDPEGKGAANAFRMAIKTADESVENIDYINAHGTSTGLGDEAELHAIYNVMGDAGKKVHISSTKSTTGHLLGAAGALEAMICVKAIEQGIIPPTINLDNPSEYCQDWNLTPHKKVQKELNVVVSNSFGFGGFNASLCFRKIK